METLPQEKLSAKPRSKCFVTGRKMNIDLMVQDLGDEWLARMSVQQVTCQTGLKALELKLRSANTWLQILRTSREHFSSACCLGMTLQREVESKVAFVFREVRSSLLVKHSARLRHVLAYLPVW